jgi:hypothetical protein
MRTERGNKRIVSKAQYAGIMGGRILGYTASMFFFLIGIFGAILSGLGICAILIALTRGNGYESTVIELIMVITIFCISIGFAVAGWVGIMSMEEEAVIPLTRQTALDIPAEESLMRASSADTIAAESVLLRPAQSESEINSMELLRPHLPT